MGEVNIVVIAYTHNNILVYEILDDDTGYY